MEAASHGEAVGHFSLRCAADPTRDKRTEGILQIFGSSGHKALEKVWEGIGRDAVGFDTGWLAGTGTIGVSIRRLTAIWVRRE